VTELCTASHIDTPADIERRYGGLRKSTIAWTIDGGGSAIGTGDKGDVLVPFACTIVAVTLLADQTGSIVVDIKKAAYADYPPASSICAGDKPTISSDDRSNSSALTGWTTAIAEGDTLRFSVDSASTITRCAVVLTVLR
jgi:hypothetical protein